MSVRGAPEEARWVRRAPRSALPASLLQQMIARAFPGARLTEALPLAHGRRNANFKVRIEGVAEPVVLRVYEHDATLCRKEADLLRFLNRTVPIPEVIHAEPEASAGLPRFLLMRYVEGITFRDLRRGGDTESIAQAARAAGEVLAAIHRNTLNKAGWIGPGLQVGAPLLEGRHPMARFIDLCLESAPLQARVPEELRCRVNDLVWRAVPEWESRETQMHLTHGDFNKRNILVRPSGARWRVAAVVDWEFAVSGDPLGDFGNFLRYERASRPLAEPHFSEGYLHAGGRLPADWRRMSRLVDLVALCESLTHDWLPPDIELELVELVRATVECREPVFTP